MISNIRPKSLIPQGASPVFTQDTLPAALRQEHALGPGRWGVLQVFEGAVTFVDLVSGGRRKVEAPDRVTIAPEAPHKLCLYHSVLSCRVDFFTEELGEHPSLIDKEVSDRDAVRLSFKRCEEAGDFADRFYRLFLAASPEIERTFANTDFNKQRKLLRGSVYVMVTRDVRDSQARVLFDRIGDSHSRERLNIPPRLYDHWLDSLCATVRALDPQWSEELEKSWRARMRPGIQLITSVF